MLRILSAAALALAMCACEPSLPQTPPSAPIVTAMFDPTTSEVPLPNDLVFLSPVNGVCSSGDKTAAAPACTQADLLASFTHFAPANSVALIGEFPNDQEVAITIDFTQTNFGVDPSAPQTAPDLDFATFTSDNVFVFRIAGASQSEVPIDPPSAADYVRSMDDTKATLTIHNQGHAPWPPGTYALVLRGGPNGVKTKDNPPLPVYPSAVFNLLAQDVDLSDVNNLGLLKAQFGSTATALEMGRQLEAVRQLYDASAFPIADRKFPRQELAIATTFRIAPIVTSVVIDPTRGQVPLPIDLLRDLGTGRLSQLAACNFAGSSVGPDGKCLTAAANAAAAGFLALDGFSTTGTAFAPMSDFIKASSVTRTSLLVYDLSDKANPVQVDPNTLIFEPCEVTADPAQGNQACGDRSRALSNLVVFQPAGATAGDPGAVFRTKPLKDNTDYAVVLTTGILDKAGNPIGSGTPANLLKFSNSLLAGGHSAVPGLDDATAKQLDDMRGRLKPLLDKLSGAGTPRSKVAMAYTFHTQTIFSQAVQLAALPYSTAAGTGVPIGLDAKPPGDKFTKFGVVPQVPSSDIDEVLETDILTFNLIDPKTGAFNPDPTKAQPEPIHVLIATPKAAAVPDCTGALQPFGKCAPLMIFRHGMGRGRGDMLLIANSYAGAGMVTVAIDAAMHGDRSFCVSGTSGADSGCVGGAACTTTLQPGDQGDIHPPGTCGAAGFEKLPVTPTATGATDGIPKISGSLPYLLSANFFRTRDTFRQDLIDESQLVRTLAIQPPASGPSNNPVFDHMAPRGVIIDPGKIYFSGQSLGAIHGTMDVATNPRISKAALNVGGGTLVDIFTNSPEFKPAVDALLAQAGIVRGTPQFLQFLIVAKTVLDPADPVNFAGHLTSNPLPNLLPPFGGATDGSMAQTPKKILTQVANCDAVVPNPFGLVWASNVPTSPLPPALFAPNAKGTFQLFVGSGFAAADFGNPAKCTASTAISHGFLLDWSQPAVAGAAQTAIADFVRNDKLQAAVVVAPAP